MITVKKFEAEWCAPCKALKPVFEKLKTKLDNDVNISYIDIDRNPEIATEYGVRSVPTVIIEQNGQVVSRILGVQSENRYLTEINSIR